jgi:hypothetical protein
MALSASMELIRLSNFTTEADERHGGLPGGRAEVKQYARPRFAGKCGAKAVRKIPSTTKVRKAHDT